jgi:hypothetical protein
VLIYGCLWIENFFHVLENVALWADDGKIEMLSIEIRRKFAVSIAEMIDCSTQIQKGLKTAKNGIEFDFIVCWG